MSKLAIVQCGGSKIWKKDPNMGKVRAREAYTSPYFRKNVAYAKRKADRWIILSAKYGYLDPDDMIEDYNVTFKTRSTNPISIEHLKEQVLAKGLGNYNEIIVLGGEEYLQAIMGSFDGTGCDIQAPFKGKRIGERMALLGGD